MKQIEKQMIAAIKAGKNKTLDNTTIVVNAGGYIHVALHGNIIAIHRKGEGWKFSLAGWNTQTTRSRLNALCAEFGADRRGVYTKAGQAYVKRFASFVRDPMGKDTPIADNEWF